MEQLVDNIICIMVIVILLLSIGLQDNKNDKTTSRFALLAHMVLGFLITDMICDMISGKPELNVLAYIVNLLDYLWIDAAIIAFSAYLATLVGRVSKKWERVMNPGVMFTYVRIAAILILAVTGNLFIIDEAGLYVEQDPAVIVYALMIAIMLMLILVIIRNRPYFSTQQFVIMMTYLILPIIGAGVEMLTGVYIFTVISMTMAILLIYTMVQSGIIEEYRVRESVLEEISSTDLLTNMNNRRAYYNRFAALKPQENVGVIFCDLNGLKYTNDTFGHTEGDRLIVRFSELLSSVFDPKDLFRISGDEFVAVIPGIQQSTFNKKTEDLLKLIKENDSIAAIGTALGTGCCIEQLVSLAESAMYIDKREYHSLHKGLHDAR